jgi:hypothetical protein
MPWRAGVVQLAQPRLLLSRFEAGRLGQSVCRVPEIVPCGDAVCGMVATTHNPDQEDNKNLDLSKRNRPVLGITLLQNMKLQGDK